MSSGGKGYLSKNHPDFKTKLDAAEDRKKRLSPLRRRIIEHIVATGDNQSATARALECNRVSVAKALADPSVQEELHRQVGDKLSIAAAIAGNTLVNLAASGKSEYVQLQAADSILDRTGFKPPDRQMHAVQGDIRISIDLG